MKALIFLSSLVLLTQPARAEVRVFVEDSSGQALLKYENTAGEVVRAFALDVSVNRGQIVGITNFFRGESRAGATGYGIFPAAFRDHLTVTSGTNVNWEASGYTPFAVAADNPGGTLPGLNSPGVTLEFGALWNPSVAAALPRPAGTLCALKLSGPAKVSVAANAARGGIVSATPDLVLTTAFTGALVGPTILGTTLSNGLLTISFKGGELEAATTAGGGWTGTGNTNGVYTEAVGSRPAKFFRVRGF